MTLDADQLAALEAVAAGRNVFVTGPAGTGKSAVMVELVRRSAHRAMLSPDDIHVVATTGVAAMSLRDKLQTLDCPSRTSTIYRWAGIGLGARDGEDFEDAWRRIANPGQQWRDAVRRIRSTRLLIVDEVSMLPGRVLDFVSFIASRVREDARPFGGIQVVAVGDFLQLPPVAKAGRYDWAFAAPTWQALRFTPAVLRTIHRQDDPDFVRVLGEVRNGALTKAGATILKRRVALFPPAHLLRLLTHNVQVDKWNARQLEAVDEPLATYHADFGGNEQQVANLRKNLSCPMTLQVKRGARVMVTKNIAATGTTELVAANGDLGTVTDHDRDSIAVRLDAGGEIVLSPHKFTDSALGTGWVAQIPLRLAWAATIHKSQGLTLDAALVDIRAAREPGQAYVALSRVRSLAGLHLKDWVAGLFVSPQARDFHSRLTSPQPLTTTTTATP